MSKKAGSLFLLVVFLWMSHGYGALCSVAEILDSPLVVNLARSPERFEVTKGWMELAGFTNIQRWDAVDGKSADEALFESLHIIRGSPGEKGCAASHLLLWKEFAESEGDGQYLFICEDDMLPHSQFAELFPIYWSETPEDFDFVLAGNWFSRKWLERDLRAGNYPLVVSFPSYCSHAYIVSKKGAKKLFKQYLNSSRSFAAIDHFISDLLSSQEMKGYCYNGTVFPEKNPFYKALIVESYDTGICFQNAQLQSTILMRDEVVDSTN